MAKEPPLEEIWKKKITLPSQSGRVRIPEQHNISGNVGYLVIKGRE